MIKGKFVGGKLYGAILAFELIAVKDVHAIEFYILSDLVSLKEAEYFREFEGCGYGADEFIVILVDHLGPFRQKKNHGLLPRNYFYREIVAIEEQRSHSSIVA